MFQLDCSSVQADGFNGTRGGWVSFPLAAPCSRCLEGHLYSVCPLCIPSLSLNQDTNGGGVVEGGGGEDDENRLNDKFGNAT